MKKLASRNPFVTLAKQRKAVVEKALKGKGSYVRKKIRVHDVKPN